MLFCMKYYNFHICLGKRTRPNMQTFNQCENIDFNRQCTTTSGKLFLHILLILLCFINKS